jgi:hypothetical protein
MKPAPLFEQIEDKKVRCRLCHHGCPISDQKFGLCHVRQNLDGKLHTLADGRVIASHVDPAEKTPHFSPTLFPGSLKISMVRPFSSLNFWECVLVWGEIIKRVAPRDVNFDWTSCRASSSRLQNGHQRPL